MVHGSIRIACAGFAASALLITAAASLVSAPLLRTTTTAPEPAPAFDVLDEFVDALRVLQDDYFELWIGTWPQAIDWTAAVTGTYVAGALSSLSGALPAHDEDFKAKENLITTYFSQLLSYYFGQDAFGIRNEAYDDMQWVVLGWLEAIEFINYHTLVNYRRPATAGTTAGTASDMSEYLRNQTWYGNLWTPAFAHRARIFWDLAEHGWNTTLCGGGMVWNPRLEPYKNAITNQLFVASSASMYLYFPGDPNPSPFSSLDSRADAKGAAPGDSEKPHELKHLRAALRAYRWLLGSGMTNSQGLYVDGFHINGWKNATNPNTKCNARNDMVYTYNQGVLLTGQIGLWKATGDTRFLDDGHALIRAVVRATGYDLENDRPMDDLSTLRPGRLPPWRGLGRAGVMEDQCDIAGECSQDSQTFKGIYFHHLAAFCAPLDIVATRGSLSAATQQALDTHLTACGAYIGWIRHNALAALATKDATGKFGMWWTAGLLNLSAGSLPAVQVGMPPLDDSRVDYRTHGVPLDDTWTSEPAAHVGPAPDAYRGQAPLTGRARAKRGASGAGGGQYGPGTHRSKQQMGTGDASDPNTRGRGRTVETQGGGLAVLRALWEITNRTNRTSQTNR